MLATDLENKNDIYLASKVALNTVIIMFTQRNKHTQTPASLAFSYSYV